MNMLNGISFKGQIQQTGGIDKNIKTPTFKNTSNSLERIPDKDTVSFSKRNAVEFPEYTPTSGPEYIPTGGPEYTPTSGPEYIPAED